MLTTLSPKKHVKIIATIGPASDSLEVLEALVNAGVNVIRLNMSHGTQEDHQNRIARIRVMARKLERSLGILADLQGPKIRTGLLEDHQPILLTQGEVVRFTCATPLGKPGVITTNFEPLLTDLQPGHTVLMDDGQLRLKVMFRVDEKTLDCQVLQGGLLDEHKGINVPEISLGVSALTEKDKADALFCLEEGVDFFALSFVRSAQDILDLRDWIQSHGHDVPPIIAKIEKPQALEEIASILQAADGLMVARGDLGVELPSEQVPVLQKMLVETANNAGKPVIIATQMLESMINSVQPTRAEVSDVANGVFDGTDALMLSGESAKGKHPIEAVSMMNRIIIEAEKNPRNPRLTSEVHVAPLDSNFSDAIAHSAVDAAFKANAKAIVVFSNSGKMALRVSKLKPNQEIIVLTPHLKVYQQLSLLWGVTPVVVPWGPNTDETLAQGEALILSRKLLEEGDTIVFCAGATPFHGATNMLKVYRIGSAILS